MGFVDNCSIYCISYGVCIFMISSDKDVKWFEESSFIGPRWLCEFNFEFALKTKHR